MTGWVSSNGNPLSYLTAYSLKDMGYTIDENSTVIDKTFTLKTALADPLPGSKPVQSIQLTGCLDHWDHGTKMPKSLLKKRDLSEEAWRELQSARRGSSKH